MKESRLQLSILAQCWLVGQYTNSTRDWPSDNRGKCRLQTWNSVQNIMWQIFLSLADRQTDVLTISYLIESHRYIHLFQSLTFWYTRLWWYDGSDIVQCSTISRGGRDSTGQKYPWGHHQLHKGNISVQENGSWEEPHDLNGLWPLASKTEIKTNCPEYNFQLCFYINTEIIEKVRHDKSV